MMTEQQERDRDLEERANRKNLQCPKCGSSTWHRDGDWGPDGKQTAEYMLCDDCQHVEHGHVVKQ